MKKNLLKEQYARLFKGRVSSNDASLITEAVTKLNHDYDDDGDIRINGRVNGNEFEAMVDNYGGGNVYRFYVKEPSTRAMALISDTDPLHKELEDAVEAYTKANRLDFQKGKGQRPAGNEVETLDEPLSAIFGGNLGTVSGLPVESISLHYFGTVVNLNAYIEGAEDYYGDDSVIEQLQDTVDRMQGKREYREWIKEIETMGYHSAKDIETALDGVEYTESGMNQDGDVSTEYYLD